MTKNDVVVVCRGTKVVGKNKTQIALLQLKNIVENYKQTNIFVMRIPHRYEDPSTDGRITSSRIFAKWRLKTG